jgi:hypothetical protein
VAWREQPGLWHVDGGLRSLFGRPFGLGPPLHRLLREAGDAEIRALAAGLGIPPHPAPSMLRAKIETRLSDADHVLAVAAGAPREAADVLHSLTWHDSASGLATVFPTPNGGSESWDDEDVDAAQGALAAYEMVRRWLSSHGFLIRAGWEDHMPREVALSLRGANWRPPVQAQPAVAQVPVSEVAVRSDCAAAAAHLVRDAVRILAVLGERPAALLRSDSSGIGVREVRRLAAEAGTEARRVDLMLLLFAALGLVRRGVDRVEVAPYADEWRERDPARQLVDLVREWWLADEGMTHRPDPRSGKQKPLLGWVPTSSRPRHLRQAVIAVLSDLPSDRGTTGPQGVKTAACWRRPLGMPGPDDVDDAFAAIWWEAQVLGLIGVGAATPLARALVAMGGSELQVLEQAAALLPSLTTTAVFQSDLTALVDGVASAPLTDLLGECADLEASGTGAQWRFSEATVRRALDAGTSPQELIDRLTAVARRDLPQPLTYLIQDVGRRHGHVNVVELGSAVVSADDTLLTEVLHTRSLRRLGLRRLAPQVLGSREAAAHTTEALRDAGFMPVVEDADGRVVVTRRALPGEESSRRAVRSALGPGVAAFGRGLREGDPQGLDDAARRLAARVLDG